MSPVLIGLIVLIVMMTAVIIVQNRARRVRDRDLAYIEQKLNDIIVSHTSEQLLLFTEDRRIQKLLIELNRLLANHNKIEADHTRTELSIKRMLANMSHDLRTPLTVVLGLAETLSLDDSLSIEERVRLLKKVHEKAHEILGLMNKFFDLAKLESGDQDLPLMKLNMNEICKNHILSFYDNISSQGYEVVIDIPDMPIYALANEEAMGRILDNLISNAIRYGGDGKFIGVSLKNNEDHVFIEVIDHGKGVSEQYQKLVFERLFTLEDSRNHSYQGSGLGLTITKRLVELMGGQISLHSIPGERTVFTIQLKKISFSMGSDQ